MFQVHWIDNKGAGRMKIFRDQKSLNEFLYKLRHEASIKNADGVEIGEVFKYDRRWYWGYDQDAAPCSGTA